MYMGVQRVYGKNYDETLCYGSRQKKIDLKKIVF